ncbi:MAG: helix-turn-helix transcriptional regulator [Burkholderiaceae bacterium]
MHASQEASGASSSPDKRVTPRAYVNMKGLCEHLDVSESTAHRMRNQPWFPRPLVLAPKVLRWSVAEVDEAMRRYAPRLELGSVQEPEGLASSRAVGRKLEGRLA